jgi:hypothetical protein
MSKKKIDREKALEIIRNRAGKKLSKDIAEEIGCSLSKAKSLARDIGTSLKMGTNKPEVLAFIRENKETMTVKDVALHFDIPISRVRSYCSEIKVTLKFLLNRNPDYKPAKKTTVPVGFFNVGASKDWILGFAY